MLTPFRIALGLGLAITLGGKFWAGAGVTNPTDPEILAAVTPFWEAQGYLVAGPTEFGGRAALLVSQRTCLMYVVPVAHQGWHQATVRQALQPSQRLWFEYAGSVTADKQPAWQPQLSYYATKGLALMGLDVPYVPMFALVGGDECRPGDLPWRDTPRISFRRVGLLAGDSP